MVVTGSTSNIYRDIIMRERRARPRTVISRQALVHFRGQRSVFPCHVRDIASTGAGVRLQDVHIFPLEFDLSFDGFRTTQHCKVIWRDNYFCGVAF